MQMNNADRTQGDEILEVEAKEFDDDFYEFRVAIKEMERRLGAVVTQAFDDCTVSSQAI